MSARAQKQRRKPAAPVRTPRTPRAPVAPIALPRAAWIVLGVLLAAGIVVCVTFPIYDPDVWQHLLVGKVIWAMKAVPRVELWSWPTYGAPDVPPSWLFRALLWPFWAAGGVTGLFAWRWLTALVTFALLWATARRAGARGVAAIPALFWCALLYRYRSQARPETLVAMLIAAQLLVLESRRAQPLAGRRLDPAWWVVPIACIWANVHLTYVVGLALTGCYLLDALRGGQRAEPKRPKTLALVLVASVLVSFVNPFGARLLAQPFQYYFFWRHEPIYRIIGELERVNWTAYARSLLPLWLLAVVGLALWRWRRAGIDWVETGILVAFLPQALGTQRFLGLFAVMVAPFFARDLELAVARWRVPVPWRGPWARVGVAAAAMVALWAPTLTDRSLMPGWSVRWSAFPVSASDWMRDHDVQGRGYNTSEFGGYLAWRGWPDRDRLPFMDIHQAGTARDRVLAADAPINPASWRALDDERRFDWALVPTRAHPEEHILEYLDTDTTSWAMVSWDDAGALFLRRNGSMASLAERERYRMLPGGRTRLAALDSTISVDSTARRQFRAELLRAIASSPVSGSARNNLATLELADGHWDAARHELEILSRAGDDYQRLHERLGITWLMQGHAREALAEFEREKRAWPESPSADFRIGQALQALGRREPARAAYQRALRQPRVRSAAAAALRSLDAVSQPPP